MVLEHAVINIKLGVSREFEEAVAEAKSVVAEPASLSRTSNSAAGS